MEIVDRRPVTEAQLQHDLAALGVRPSAPLIVHSSMRAVGWVLGGAATIVRALIGALDEGGTLAMPAATPLCGDPAAWQAPRVAERWLAEVRDQLPVFDAATTPTTLGAVPETFRRWPGTLRSDHPLQSVCARGAHAAAITADHPPAFSEGPGTPFGRLHELDADVLLLGVDFGRCTALHLAETLSIKRRLHTVRVLVEEGGARRWVEVDNVANDNGRVFPVVGERYLAVGRARTGPVGEATATLCSMVDLVAFARAYFDANL